MLFVDVESNRLLYLPELDELLNRLLLLRLPRNRLKGAIFHLNDQGSASGTEKLLNQIKCASVLVLSITIRTLVSTVKEPKLLHVNPVYKRTGQHLGVLIESIQQLMRNTPYYEIGERAVLETLDEVYCLLVVALKANDFYGVFVKHKEGMIEDLVFRALALTPLDRRNYKEDPEEFLNSLLHIVERDVRSKQDEDPESFETLRTHAAEFLNAFCKYQDGCLTEIMQYTFMVLEGKLNSEFGPELMLLVLAVLRDVSRDRKDLHVMVAALIHKLLNELPAPTKTQSQRTCNSDLQHALAMLLLCRYFSRILLVNPKIIDFSFGLCFHLLSDPQAEQTPKLLALDLVEVINHLEEGEPYSPRILATFNQLLKGSLGADSPRPSQKLLEAYFSLLKYNDVKLKRSSVDELVRTVEIVSQCIRQEVESGKHEQIVVNKLWNVIREIGENPEFIPLMVEPIEKAIMPLVPFIDGQRNLDFEEDILMLMTQAQIAIDSAFIEKSRQVTERQLAMFEIIPKIFYNQYLGSFGHAFQTMQVFIFHGHEILKAAPKAIQEIINMALTSLSQSQYMGKVLSEADNCQGALLLQSLIIACGLTIDQAAYQKIAETIMKRLEHDLRYDLLKSNLVAALALVLVHGCERFSNEVSDHLLSVVLSRIACFEKVPYAPKVLIVSLNQLLLKTQLEFVGRRFTQIFDTVITLLQILSTKKTVSAYDEDDEDDVQRDYDNSLAVTTTTVMHMDQFQDFKNLVRKLKDMNQTQLQSRVDELPQGKKDFLKNVLGVERVGAANEPRKIFTIRRNQ